MGFIHHNSPEPSENNLWEVLLRFNHVFLCDQVRASGLSVNSTLENLIRQSRVQDVRYALKVVEETRKREVVRNPEGLFYRVLDSQRQSHGDSAQWSIT